MLDQIQKLFEESAYDFRTLANPDDPLSELFPAWIDSYRLKVAIAAALQPRSILEIGVRFGYSAAAFLHGAPTAHYTGIDADTTVSGGCVGAMEWARKILPQGQFKLIRGDSQRMDRFPDEQYDLIHVDGQQDADGTYRDLEKSLRQARHVLIDGYLSGDQQFQAVNACLFSHRNEINWAITLGGHAGELLIEVKRAAANRPTNGNVKSSLEIRDSYDRKYYLTDCGGWSDFAANRGRLLSDSRLITLLDLALMGNPRRLLDLGCGRGEITRQAARQGCTVEAVDYSADAIAIALAAVNEEPAISHRVRFQCSDACTIELKEPVDAVVAGDIVEHLTPAELDEMYSRVARSLSPNGLFVVHTAPNLWFYTYHYVRQRREAARLGLYLPPDPRTDYERRMHINEQSPRVLRRQLQRHFPHVLLWFASTENPAGSLIARMKPQDLAAQRDLFALASHAPIERNRVINLFKSTPISEVEVAAIRLSSPGAGALRLKPRERSHVAVELENGSDRILANQHPNPIRFAYHWVRATDHTVVVFNGHRSEVSPACPPGATQTYCPEFVAPDEPGAYRLQITLLQEGVRWFDWTNPQAVVELAVQVGSS